MTTSASPRTAPIYSRAGVDFLLTTRLPEPQDRFVFASVDSRFNGGQLVTKVAESIDIALPSVPPPSGQFLRLVHRDGHQSLGLIQTVSADAMPGQNLSRNLKGYLRAHPIAGHTSWIPFMATGSGGLSFIAAAELILDALIGALYPDAYGSDRATTIMLAAPAAEGADFFDNLRDSCEAYLREHVPGPADRKPGQPEPRRATGTQLNDDHPVETVAGDLLGRKAIGQAIATNLRQSWKAEGGQDRPFIVHLSGRWGSGKSTVLNFLEHYLTSPSEADRADPRSNDAEWIIVKYNAWQQQSDGRAWWSLLNAVAGEAPKDLPFLSRWWFRLMDRRWRVTAQYKTLIYGTVALLLTALFFALSDSEPANDLPPGATRTVTEIREGTVPEITEDGAIRPAGRMVERLETIERGTAAKTVWERIVDLKELIAIGLAVLTAFGGFFVRRQKTEAMLKDLSLDPTAPLRRRYAAMIRQLKRPVAVFIDDVDRCDAGFVVEILQAAQNVYSDVPVLYVISSDKDWIVSAYEQRYAEFAGQVARPGRPLGHLFVEKIFQLSVHIPDLGASERDAYLHRLVGAQANQTSEEATETLRSFDSELSEAGGDIEKIRSAYRKVGNLAIAPEAQARAFQAVQSADAEAQLTHYLEDYKHLMDPNPRAMKRVVNAFQFLQGYAFLANKDVRVQALILWVILDLRFPQVTRRLHRNPLEWDEADMEKYYSSDVIKTILDQLSVEEIETLRSFG